MKDFEDKLRQAIDPANGYDPAREETFREFLTEGFRGRNLLVSAIAWGLVALLILLATICAILFFRSSTEREWILYAALFLVLNTDLVLIKLWFWQRWTRNSVLREMKLFEERMLRLLAERQK